MADVAHILIRIRTGIDLVAVRHFFPRWSLVNSSGTRAQPSGRLVDMPNPEDSSAFIGYWKITHMDVWAQSYVDLVVPGFIEFTDEDDLLMGRFQFGTVSGWLHCGLRDVGGDTFIEWSWQGRSDADPGCGRGWATLVGGELVGHMFIHCADDSTFRATKQPRPAERPERAVTRRAKSTTPRHH
jgi:hypothetical protein